MRSNLHRSKEKMPCNIHGGVEQCGGENRAGLAPSPTVEKTGDGGQDYVAPVGEAHVGDVREAEENGGGPPAGKIALRSTRKQILEEAEEENADGNEGQRLQLRPLRIELNEMDGLAQGNGDASENDETCGDEKAPMMAPPAGVADAIDAEQKQRGRAEVKPVRRRPQPA